MCAPDPSPQSPVPSPSVDRFETGSRLTSRPVLDDKCAGMNVFRCCECSCCPAGDLSGLSGAAFTEIVPRYYPLQHEQGSQPTAGAGGSRSPGALAFQGVFA